MADTILLVDGHNLLFRSYAVPFRFYSKSGVPLHVITTYLSQLRKVIEFINPQYLSIVWDSQGQTSRQKISSDYKSNRKKDYSKETDSPFHHLKYIQKVLDFLRLNQIEINGIEGDDIVATIVKKFNSTAKGNKAYIFSTDTDFYQLISQNTNIIRVKRNEISCIDLDWIKCNLEIYPNEYIYYKALIGDLTDNILGVKGIGPKTAAKIINKTISYDLSSYDNLITLNQNLIRLKESLPVEFQIDKAQVNDRLLKMNNKEIFTALQF